MANPEDLPVAIYPLPKVTVWMIATPHIIHLTAKIHNFHLLALTKCST